MRKKFRKRELEDRRRGEGYEREELMKTEEEGGWSEKIK